LRIALLKVDPFQNYPEYINFHRVNVDDPSAQNAKIRLTVQNNILTCDDAKAVEYAKVAPSFDLVVVLCNVKNVRSTGGPPVITIDSDLDLGRVFLHEMGHAFASLNDEYVDSTLANQPFKEDPEDEWVTNVTAQSNPKLSRWHYWLQDVWPAAHDMNKLPPGHRVGCYEGAAYKAKGVYRPEEHCLMQTGDKYCVVCFEQVEKKFYRLIQPIDDARPRKPLVGAWLDDVVVLEADAIRTAATGSERIGKFEGLWYVDSKPKNANSKDLTTIMSLKASELGAGMHEAGLRVDFSNRRVRRDDGWLSSSAGWKIDVLKYKKPKWDGPDKVPAKVGQPLTFDMKIEIPDPVAFRVEVKDLPEGATYENSKFTWTPAKAHQGGWRPRFILTDGLRTIERAVEIAVLDAAEKNYEPIFSPMDAVVVNEGEPLELTLEVVDVDGDNLVFTSANLPEGAELDVYDGVLRWKPGAHQSGRYPGIAIDVFDGRRHVKGTVEIQVDDAIRYQGPKRDPVHGLRSPYFKVRGQALEELGAAQFPKTYQYMEAARLLRDKGHEVREAALAMLKTLLDGADAPFIAMMIRDLAPHAWHFTDHKDTLTWLDQLMSKGEAASPDTKALKLALKGIEKYNKERGF
ncbi:MAG TPA: M64 family metallopeptidase, partial [Planctomycetota bacterium]|nr:M64 family metallopeptidase [Planctomycetota bacterium]